VLQHFRVEVHQVAQSQAGRFQIRKHLQAMDFSQARNRFQFDDQNAFD
jgi:hypothetical protein